MIVVNCVVSMMFYQGSHRKSPQISYSSYKRNRSLQNHNKMNKMNGMNKYIMILALIQRKKKGIYTEQTEIRYEDVVVECVANVLIRRRCHVSIHS